MVGDRLDTDIEGAFNGEVDSLLVLTGVTDAEQLLRAEPRHRPTYVDRDLRGLLAGQPEVEPVEDGFRCGGWTAAALNSGVLELREAGGAGRDGGDGGDAAADVDPVDGLRALCAAAWTAAGDGVCTLDAAKALARLGL